MLAVPPTPGLSYSFKVAFDGQNATGAFWTGTIASKGGPDGVRKQSTRSDSLQIVLIRACLYGRGACADFALKSVALIKTSPTDWKGGPSRREKQCNCHPTAVQQCKILSERTTVGRQIKMWHAPVGTRPSPDSRDTVLPAPAGQGWFRAIQGDCADDSPPPFSALPPPPTCP